MKTEDLKAHGLTDEQIAFVMAENGRDIGKVQKKLEDITAERDKEKERADSAAETLKKFEGVDVEAIRKEVADWQKKAQDAEAEYGKKIAERDFDDLLKDAIATAKGINPKAIKALLDVDALKASKNQKEDVASAIKALAEAEDSKMLFKSEPAQQTTPHFTTAKTGSNGSGTVTKESIMQVKNTAERQALIAQHMDLFSK